MRLKNEQFEFGPFKLQPDNRVLLSGETSLPLTPKAFDTLVYLVRHRGSLVTRDELLKAVWPDSFVEEGNISVHIFQLRKVLGETEGGRPYIETVPRKGYRFGAPVRLLEVDVPAAPLRAPLVLQPEAALEPGLVADEHGDEKPDAVFFPPERNASRITEAVARRPEIIEFPDVNRPPVRELPPEPGSPAEIPTQTREQKRISSLKHQRSLAVAICLVVIGLVAGWFLWHRSQQPPQPRERRLTSFASGMAVTAAAISSGAKFIAYANPGGLLIQVISTGETRALPLPRPHFEVSSISWFPDSASLLVDGSAPRDATPSLWIVPVIGTTSPIELGPYPPGTVSPDASQIALVNNHGAAPEIQLMSAQGGGIRTLVTGGEGEIFGSVRWFHDGRRLLFVRYRWDPQFRRNSGSIDAYDLTRGKTQTVMAGVDFGGDAVTLPNGRIVYSKFSGANPSTSGSELMEIGTDRRTGKAFGAPVVLARWDAPVAGITVSASGARLVLRDLFVQHNVYLASLKDGGTSLGSVSRFSFGLGREDFPSAWTPDGRALFVDTNRNGNWQIYKRALDSESGSPFVAGQNDAFSPRVSPDGAWLLYIERPVNWHEGQPARLMRIPIAGGLPQPVLTASGFSRWGLRFECPRRAGMPCVLAQRQGNQVAFLPFDPEKGLLPPDRQIARFNAPAPIQWTIAPDGSGLAWISPDPGETIIHVLPLSYGPDGWAAGQQREVAVKSWPLPRSISWASGGKGWFVVSSSGPSWTLLYVTQQGKPDVLLRVPSNWPPDVYPSPDGRHLAFSEQSFSSNVWILGRF